MSVVKRVEVYSDRFTESSLPQKAKNLHNIFLEKIYHSSLFKIQTHEPEKLDQILHEEGHMVFFDPITEKMILSQDQIPFTHHHPDLVVEITPKAGVTDNLANTTQEALSLCGLNAKVSTGKIYYLFGQLSSHQAYELATSYLGNPLIADIHVLSFDQFLQKNRFDNPQLPQVKINHNTTYEVINLNLSDEQLIKLSTDRTLALTLDEMLFIKNYYQRQDVLEERKIAGLPSSPTDVELEILAQTWSEHCKHKIFASTIEFNGPKGHETIQSLYKSYIKRSTYELIQEGLDWATSVFSDNAGIVNFDQHLDLSIKVETHNSPSALDPYGGAITGILGVNRDILGVGMGHRPIANTDVFCFANPSDEKFNNKNAIPQLLKHPRQIVEGVHKGIVDGGNKSGIPTVNGAFYFDDAFAGKPLVFCGTIGCAPKQINARPTSHKRIQPGDRIYMVGGPIGADGIHGATFSSLELNESSPATAVQIGDPLTQKRVTDFLIQARDSELFTGLTDNGAGGLSSSVGEMANATGGATIDVALAPTKYPGLSPYELVISESQERMSVAVNIVNCLEFEQMAKSHGVSATNIGYFHTNGYFEILYNNKLMAKLPLGLMHEDLPPLKLKAMWDGPRAYQSWICPPAKIMAPNPDAVGAMTVLSTLLQRPNIKSKEPLIRQYDHEVQAATHIKPFNTALDSTPNDAGVIWLAPHHGEQTNAISIGCGLNPRLSQHDPQLMAQFAVDEAVRNVVATGGDIDHCCLLDNFCWPDPVETTKNPDGSYKLGQLVLACQGLYEIVKTYKTPLVSGKDSMKNDFKGKMPDGSPVTISIHPTLMVTAMAKTSIDHTCTSDFKASGHLIYLLGKHTEGLIGSEFLQVFELNGTNVNCSKVPRPNLLGNHKLYRQMKEAFELGLIQSCHDVSDGGILTAIAESTFARKVGVRIEVLLPEDQIFDFLFNEACGRFIVSVLPQQKETFEAHFGEQITFLGSTQHKQIFGLHINNNHHEMILDSVLAKWKGDL